MKRTDVLKFWLVFRSAETGQFVSRAFAFAQPATTISEKRWPDRKQPNGEKP